MAVVIREGRGGEKEDMLRFNQPKGQVTTTSSKFVGSFEAVVMTTEGRRPLSVTDLMKVTFVDFLSSALASAPLATRLRIDLYVLAKKRFSGNRESRYLAAFLWSRNTIVYLPPSIHSSSQKNLKLCFSIGSPTKSPHIRAIWNMSLEEASSNPFALTSLLKKSMRELCGAIEDPFSLLNLNALAMISQTISECVVALWLSTR